MVGEAAEKKLYDAARKGDAATFKQLLQENPDLVDAVTFAGPRSLFHIAIKQGHVSIVEEVLRMNPQIVLDLDSKTSSPLHIAAAQGQLEIVKKLLSVAPETCWWRDCHDMNPVHVAAMKGHVELLKVLLQEDSLPAMERLHRGQTVLHLCVKHRQLQALKFLVEKLGELACAMDDDGETLLHLAVRSEQVEMIQYLVTESNKIKKQTPNSTGKTALDILNESPPNKTIYLEIRKLLIRLSNQSIFRGLPKLTDITMVVVVLIATMAFQAAVTPPGGVWQDDSASNAATSPYKAGEAVMASTHPKIYKHFVQSNTIAFISSLITIFLVTTGLPLQHLFFLAIATFAMWVSLGSIVASFGVSLILTNPKKTQSYGKVVGIVVSAFAAIVALILAYLYMLGLYLSWKRKKRQHEDLTTANLILRWLYQIFQLLEDSLGNLIVGYMRFLRRLSGISDSPPPNTVQPQVA